MPRTLADKPHKYLRLSGAIESANLGKIEDLLPALVQKGWTLRQIVRHLSEELPDPSVIPTPATLGEYYRLIMEEKEETNVANS